MEQLTDDVWLIDGQECQIEDLWVRRHPTLERQYVVVHLAPRPIFGVHGDLPEAIEKEVAGYFDGRYITYAELTNGHAIVDDDKVVEIEGAEWRRRNLIDDFMFLAPGTIDSQILF